MNLPGIDYSIDTLHVGDSLSSFPDQCQQTLKDMAEVPLPESFGQVHHIVVSGMGGSALGGRVISSLERQVLRVPVIISTEYHLPNFVDENSLVIVSSYSGNTDETVASLAEARARNAKIFILSSGGVLAEKMKEFSLPGFIFDPRFNLSGQPRMGLGYNILAIISLLSRSGLINELSQLSSLPDFLRKRQERLNDFADIARSLKGYIPVIVASEHLKGAAHCFKNQLNENAKTFACLFDLPELNHHLLESLSSPKPGIDRLKILFINSTKYHPEIVKRYPITAQVFQKQSCQTMDFHPQGSDRLFEAMDVIQAGGYIAYYLALLNGIDPGPIPWVNWYKDEIRKMV